MKYLLILLLTGCGAAHPIEDASADASVDDAVADAGPEVAPDAAPDTAQPDTTTLPDTALPPLDVPCSETTINCLDNPGTPTCDDVSGAAHPECEPACSDTLSELLCDSAEGSFCLRPDSTPGCVPR